ncbi:MAG: hypothetical protein FJ387_18885, partial [Verrucomicrobia bacterium]|nr:hypothetical protein [Verrucomicrobiota bacterium]
MTEATLFSGLSVMAAGPSLQIFSGATTEYDRPLVVGAVGCCNILLVTDGAILRTPQAFLGRAPGADNNTAIVNGPGSVWVAGQHVELGFYGKENQVVVTNEARLECRRLTIGVGSNTAAHNRLAIGGRGSTCEIGELWLGEYGASNQLWVLNGARLRTGLVFFNRGTGGTDNAALVSGLESEWRAGHIDMGGINPELTVFNGGLVSCDTSRIDLYAKATIGGGGSMWQVTTNLTITGPSSSNKLVRIEPGGTLAVTNGSGTALLDLRAHHLLIAGGRVVADNVVVTGRNAAALELAAGVLSVRNLTAADARFLVLGGGGAAARIVLQDGTIDVASAFQINSDVVFTGTGTLAHAATNLATVRVMNRGILAPGNPVGRLTVQDRLWTEGEVWVDIGGRQPAAGYDQLFVKERVWLGGTLRVFAHAGFRPAWTDTFMVLRWGQREGEFRNAANMSRLPVETGGSFRVWYLSEGLTLSDFQQDQDQDGIDDLWARTYFGHTPLSSAERLADSDGDGVVNQDEFIAGTDPTDARSLLRIAAVVPEGNRVRVRFSPAGNKWYRVWYASALPLWREIAQPTFSQPAPGVFEWIDDGTQTDPSRPRFYRVSA